MKKIKAIIVDDEEGARDVLENLLLRFCTEVEIIAKCENVLKAVEIINQEQPDLVFWILKCLTIRALKSLPFLRK